MEYRNLLVLRWLDRHADVAYSPYEVGNTVASSEMLVTVLHVLSVIQLGVVMYHFRDRQRQLRKWQKQFGKQQEQQKKVNFELILLIMLPVICL